jgi:predicted house-cleaning noncanonical NTP pyrophosphatase (MazG superfamily)
MHLMKVYNKLVRDRIPQIIIGNGEKPITRVLNETEYLHELIKKLKEETAELEAELILNKNGLIGQNKSKVSKALEELADIKEVTIAIREAMGIHAGELEDVRRQKADKNGRFKKRIYLEAVE